VFLSVCRILSEFLQRIPMFDERKNQKDLQVKILVTKPELIWTNLYSVHIHMYLICCCAEL